MSLHNLITTIVICFAVSPKTCLSICLFPLRVIQIVGYNIGDGILYWIAGIVERRRRPNGYIPTDAENILLFHTKVANCGNGLRARIEAMIVKRQASEWETCKLSREEIREIIAAHEMVKNTTKQS